MTTGERIHFFRKIHHLKQSDFADILGISRTHISKIENNQDNPSDKLLERMSAMFGINYEWLKDGNGEMENININDNSLNECVLTLQQFKSEHTFDDNETIAFAIMETVKFVRIMSDFAQKGYISSIKEIKYIFLELKNISEYWKKESMNNEGNILSVKDGKNKYDEISDITDIYANRIYGAIKVLLNDFLASSDFLNNYFENEIEKEELNYKSKKE